MKCEKVITKYCKLDKNESLPLRVSIHIILCSKCKELILQMEKTQKVKNVALQKKSSSDTISQIMQKINTIKITNPKPKNEKTDFIFFFITTTLLVLPFIIIPILSLGQILTKNLGIFFVLSLGLLYTFIVLIICALFVIKNAKYFVKRFLD